MRDRKRIAWLAASLARLVQTKQRQLDTSAMAAVASCQAIHGTHGTEFSLLLRMHANSSCGECAGGCGRHKTVALKLGPGKAGLAEGCFTIPCVRACARQPPPASMRHVLPLEVIALPFVDSPRDPASTH